ncbi:MAG: hypothetical protein ACYC5H_12160 [Methylovirgula sp.]
MTDDVTIKFTADTSRLQSGMQDAAASVNATAGTLRNGAAQIAGSFGALSAAYANSTAQRLQSAQQAGAQMLAMAREREDASYRIALTGVKLNQALVREEVQTGQASHEQQLASLLALEDEREAIERRHLQSLSLNAAAGSADYERYQLKLTEVATQGALRRQQIELAYNRQVYNDYRRTFDQIGSSVSSAIMGMIEGHETLRQAERKVLLGILQDFIQARIRMVADWAAGVAAQVTATQVGEAAKTMAVTTGVAARTAAEAGGASASLAASAAGMIQQIVADARAAFAGVFAFLAPVLGPAAAGPAAAAMGTVTGMASFAVGSWQLPSDMVAQVHQGEMIVPAAQTPWAQGVMSHAAASNGGENSGMTLNHATHFNIQAMDSQDVKRWFKANGKTVMRSINESVRYGAHLGMSKLA